LTCAWLRQAGGAIINIASVLAVTPEYPLGAYGATKSYVLALSQNLQSELGSRGIYVLHRQCCPQQPERRSGSALAGT
jgi:short-subunit dehydrogenase